MGGKHPALDDPGHDGEIIAGVGEHLGDGINGVGVGGHRLDFRGAGSELGELHWYDCCVLTDRHKRSEVVGCVEPYRTSSKSL